MADPTPDPLLAASENVAASPPPVPRSQTIMQMPSAQTVLGELYTLDQAKPKPKGKAAKKPNTQATTQDYNFLIQVYRAAGQSKSFIDQQINQIRSGSLAYTQALTDAEIQYTQRLSGTRSSQDASGDILTLDAQGNPTSVPFYQAFVEPLQWETTDPNKLMALQAQLAQISPALGGLMGQSYMAGTYDPNTAAAFSKILESATQAGMNWPSYLNQAQTTTKNLTKSSVPSFNPVADADVQQSVISAFQKALGRNPTPSETATFTGQYRTAESAAYSKIVNAYESRAAQGISGPVAVGADTDPTTGARFPNATDLTYQGIFHSPEAQQYQQTSLGMDLRNLIGGSRLQ